MKKLHPHCGTCSQCIDRRFAILAAGQEDEDPADRYNVDLLLGEREAGPNREMALAFVRSASIINQLSEVAFFGQYGETSRILGFFQEPANTVAGRIFGLYKRHAASTCRVFDEAIEANASKIREQSLPANCLLSLIVGQRGEERIYALPSIARNQAVAATPQIRIAINEDDRRIVFDRRGEIKGASAELIIALAAPFREATRSELAPERYPFLDTPTLMRQINCESDEALRRRILRCRNKINQLSRAAGATNEPLDAVIESIQRHGYRLNPDRVRLVAISQLSRTPKG